MIERNSCAAVSPFRYLEQANYKVESDLFYNLWLCNRIEKGIATGVQHACEKSWAAFS